VEAIRSIIYAGKSWFSPLVIRDGRISHPEEQTLTEQEVRILRELLLGKSEYQIAEALGWAEERVARYLKLLMMKFDVHDIPSLVHIAGRILRPAA
jgi:DNA-binding NarL/FixJ family response regulator